MFLTVAVYANVDTSTVVTILNSRDRCIGGCSDLHASPRAGEPSSFIGRVAVFLKDVLLVEVIDANLPISGFVRFMEQI